MKSWPRILRGGRRRSVTRSGRRVGLAILFLLLWLPLVACPGPVQAGADPGASADGWGPDGLPERPLEPEFFPLPENVEVLRLENGIQVVLMRNPAQPMVGIYTQVRVGSAHEDFRTSGMSHMLEHLLFNGTDDFNQQELYDLADLHGAYNNAHTSDFFTNYMMVLPARSLATGLLIQSQMLFHSVLPRDKFGKEKGIVLGELVSARDRGDHFTAELVREVLYSGSSLSLPTLGTRSTIEHMKRNEVFSFYKEFYVPNNMTITLAGNFEPEEALDLVEEYYGSIPPGKVDRPAMRPAEFLDQTRSVVRRGGNQRLLAFAFDAPGYDSNDFFPFLVLVHLLDAPGSGILTRALAELPAAERPELSVRWEKAAGFARLVLEFDLPIGADPHRFYDLVQEAFAEAVTQGITAEDIVEVTRLEETETLLEREQLRMTGIYLAEPMILGGADFFVTYLPRLRAVTAQEVVKSLQAYLVDNPCLAILVEPAARPGAEAAGDPGLQLPPGMEVPPAMLEALKKAGMDPAAAPSSDTKPGRRVDPAAAPSGPVTISAGELELPVDRTQLQSGAVLVSQQNTASPLMAVHLTVRNRAVLDGDFPGAVNLVHQLLLKGVAGCDESCLARKLRRLGAVVKLVDNPHIPMDDYYTSGRFSFVRVEVAAERGFEVLELLAEIIQEANFSPEDFEQARREQASLLRKRQDSARQVANRLLAENLYGAHPLSRPAEGTAEAVRELDYERVRTTFRHAFAPENLILSVVSPFPHADLVEFAARQWPGKGEPTPPLPPLPLTAAAYRVTASLGGEMSAVRLGALLAVDPADEKALEILTAVLADRMAMDLREKRGLSYSVGASVAMHEGEGSFTAWINPPRERLAEGEQALREFVDDFDPGSITEDELNKIRNAKVGRWMMRRLSSLSQAFYLAMAELDGNTERYLTMLTGYDKLDLAELERVGKKYLAGLPMVTVVVD